MAKVDILLPTCNRLESLIFTLSGVANQSFFDFHLIISDQSDLPSRQSAVIQSLLRIIKARGATYEWHYRVPSLGIAEQRDFLLNRASSEMILYLDDDVWMEPWVLQKMVNTLVEQQCAFVGAFPAGLSFLDDVRPEQQIIEYWEGDVTPESIYPDSPEWERAHLHRAANLYHVSQQLESDESHLYKVAWIASCILYDRQKVLEVGGYSFWDRLPRFHSGEEVLLQNLLMRRWGGASIIPSGTYYAEVPSTVLNEDGTVDGHALDLLPEMVERFSPEQFS
jgi:glycosyltransferase involved in cell wall biosynthesis